MLASAKIFVRLIQFLLLIFNARGVVDHFVSDISDVSDGSDFLGAIKTVSRDDGQLYQLVMRTSPQCWSNVMKILMAGVRNVPGKDFCVSLNDHHHRVFAFELAKCHLPVEASSYYKPEGIIQDEQEFDNTGSYCESEEILQDEQKFYKCLSFERSKNIELSNTYTQFYLFTFNICERVTRELQSALLIHNTEAALEASLEVTEYVSRALENTNMAAKKIEIAVINSEMAARNSETATRNSEMATRNSEVATSSAKAANDQINDSASMLKGVASQVDQTSAKLENSSNRINKANAEMEEYFLNAKSEVSFIKQDYNSFKQDYNSFKEQEISNLSKIVQRWEEFAHVLNGFVIFLLSVQSGIYHFTIMNAIWVLTSIPSSIHARPKLFLLFLIEFVMEYIVRYAGNLPIVKSFDVDRAIFVLRFSSSLLCGVLYFLFTITEYFRNKKKLQKDEMVTVHNLRHVHAELLQKIDILLASNNERRNNEGRCLEQNSSVRMNYRNRNSYNPRYRFREAPPRISNERPTFEMSSFDPDIDEAYRRLNQYPPNIANDYQADEINYFSDGLVYQPTITPDKVRTPDGLVTRKYESLSSLDDESMQTPSVLSKRKNSNIEISREGTKKPRKVK